MKKKVIRFDTSNLLKEVLGDINNLKKNNFVVRQYESQKGKILVIRDENNTIFIRLKDVEKYLDDSDSISNKTWKHLSDKSQSDLSDINIKNDTIFISQKTLFKNILFSKRPDLNKTRKWILNYLLNSINDKKINPALEISKYDFLEDHCLSDYRGSVFYLVYIGVYNREHILKFGVSFDFPERYYRYHCKLFNTCNVIYIKKCSDCYLAKSEIKINLKSKNMLRKIKIKSFNQTDLIALNEKFNVNWCIKIIDKICNETD